MDALIIVDVQNDFVPGGALPVPEGNEIVKIVNELQQCFEKVIATQDWHPKSHGSFAVNHPGKRPGDVIELHGLKQILWPVHCVQNSKGAEFVAGLDVHPVEKVFRKGTDETVDSYSGFFDNGYKRSTGLADYLKERGIDEVFIVGLASDYCVKFTALDACQLGLRTNLIVDACRGVNLAPGDVDRAIEEMKQKGVLVTNSQSVLRQRLEKRK